MIISKKKWITMCGILLGIIPNVNCSILPSNEGTLISNISEEKGIDLLEDENFQELDLVQDKLQGSSATDSEWRVIRGDIIGLEETDAGTVRLRINKREEDQFENIREKVDERDYRIQVAHNLIPRVDSATSILKLRKYVEIKDVEWVSEKDRYQELEDREVELENKQEFIQWENDDTNLISRALTRLYAEYDGTRYEVDSKEMFRTGNVQEKYRLKNREEQTVRTFEDGVYDCQEIMPIEYYNRGDGSEYIRRLENRIEKRHKPIQSRRSGWQNNDANLSSIELLQDYVISGGKQLNTGAIRNGMNQGYVKLEAKDRDVGHLVFRDGHLEQAKQRVETYKRPDGSKYIRTIGIPSVQMGIPHPVTYNGKAWIVNPGAKFKQGTSYAYKGGFAVLDGKMFTKYQANGTVVRKEVGKDSPEFKALAETKTIPLVEVVKRAKRVMGVKVDSKRVPESRGCIEVLTSCPINRFEGWTEGYNKGLTKLKSDYVKKTINWEEIFRVE